MQNLMPPVNTPDNLFHDGDESTGVQGTFLYAEFMNNEQSAIQDIQQEAINVLAAAGFMPDPTKHNQLLLAIQKIISEGITDGVKGLTKTVNNKGPDDQGNIELSASDVGALASGGTAAAATKLATAHKIAGHDFDGTADITISAGDVGALASGGTAAAATKLATAHKIAGHDFDGTADITISAGDVGALASGGTAAAATKLATAHKIAGHAFDGTADITISAGDVGAYTKSESDSHFGSGRTVTGNSNAYYTHQDGTVFMQSVGNIQVGNNVTVTVTLPTSFPNGIIGIGSSYHGTGGNNQASFYLCIPSGKNQVQIQTHNCDGTFYLVVTGW